MESARIFSRLFHLPIRHRGTDTVAVERLIPPLHPWIEQQIQRYIQAGFPENLPEQLELTPNEYREDMAYRLEEQLKRATEEEVRRMLVIDPRVSFEKQIELFKLSTFLSNPSLIVNHPSIQKPDFPYAVVLCDPPPVLDLDQRYELNFFTTWFPLTMRGLTGIEGIAFLNQHPELASKHEDRYFLGSTYGDKPLKATTDDEKFIIDCEGPWMERFPRQVPLCRRKK